MRTEIVIRIAKAVSLQVALSLSSATYGQQTTTPDPAGYLQQRYSIADHVNLLRQGAGFHAEVIGNVTVVEQTDGLVLIDAGGSPGAGRRVVALVHGISPKPVKAVVITHWHGDHHFGLSEVLREWPRAVVIATESAKSNMNRRGLPDHPDAAFDARQKANFDRVAAGFRTQSQAAQNDTDRQRLADDARTEDAYSEDFRGISIRYANITFTERMSLLDEMAPVEIMYLGQSHTDGDAVVWLPRQEVLVAGDAVVSPVPFWRTSYPVEWIGVLEKIKAFGSSVLIPGHGVPTDNNSYVDRLIATLKNLNEQVATLAAKGLSLDETQAGMDLPSLAKTLAGNGANDSDERLKPDWAPIVACSYVEAKHVPILQGASCAIPK